MTIGEPVEGAIDAEAEVDVFSFQATARRVYEIAVEPGTLIDSVAALYNAEDQQVAYNDDYQGEPAARIYWAAAETGTYFVEVSGYDENVGTYTLAVTDLETTDEHAHTFESAALLTVGQPVEASIDYPFDFDLLAFEAREGTVYQIDVTLGTLPDSHAAIYDASDQELAYSDDYGDTSASRIVWQAPESATYFVEVSGYGEDVGTYTLVVAELENTDEHADTFEGAAPITVGETVEAAIDYQTDLDFFSFEAHEGTFYWVDVTLGTLPASDSAIFDASGQDLAYNDDYGDAPASRIVWRAPMSATFFVGVAGYDVQHIGSYTLTVAEADVADDHADALEGASTVTVGTPAAGIVDYTGDTDFFTFDSQAGKVYQIDVMLGTLGDSVAELLDEAGLQIVYNDDYEGAASRIVWGSGASGPYYVRVSGYGGAIGSYTLTVTELDIDDDASNALGGAGTLTVDAAIERVIDYPLDVDVFSFRALAGQTYQIDVALGTLEDSILSILGGDGSELAFNDDYDDATGASRLVWKATASTTFYVVVAGYGDNVGSYTLTVVATTATPAPAAAPTLTAAT